MDIEPLEEERIDPPTPTLLQRYLCLDPPTSVTIKELEAKGWSSSKARQFATHGKDSRLLVHVDRGGYVAIDPSVAIRAWALPEYYADLLVLHDALEHLDIDHAFACLTASARTGLLFDRPWLVTVERSGGQAPKVDRFTYNVQSTTSETLEVLGKRFEVPAVSPEETALLLASTGLPREVEAAEEIVQAHPPPEELIAAFNFFGITVDPEILESQRPQIEFPAFIQERRDRLGEELLRGGPS